MFSLSDRRVLNGSAIGVAFTPVAVLLALVSGGAGHGGYGGKQRCQEPIHDLAPDAFNCPRFAFGMGREDLFRRV